MKGFEEAVKYIKMYRITFAGIMRTVKVCMLEPQSQTKVRPYDAFLSFFIKHCTEVYRSTCSKFSVLLFYVPIDSSLVNAKLLSSQPQGQLSAWFAQLSGTLLLFTFLPVLTRQPWLPFQWLDT